MDYSSEIGCAGLLAVRSRLLQAGALQPAPGPLQSAPVPAAAGYLSSDSLPYLACSPQRIIENYSGPLFTLRRSDGAMRDVSPQAGGDYPDYAAIAEWADGTIPTVAVLYDQSGNGRHMVQDDPALQPGFDTGQRFGDACPILFDGFNRTPTASNPFRKRLLLADGLSLNRADASLFCAMQSQVSLNWAYPFALLDSGNSVISAIDAPNFDAANARGPNINGVTRGPSSSPDTVGFTRTATNRIYYAQGAVFNQSASNSMITARRLRIGGKNAGEVAMHAMFGFAMFDTAFSETKGAAVTASFNAAIGKPEAFDYHVLLDGDGITEGTGSRHLRNTARSMPLNKRALITNTGVHGEKLSDSANNRVGRFGELFRPGIPNVAFISGGTHDLGADGDAAAIYSNRTTLLASYLQSLGFKTVIVTILPRANSTWTAAMEMQRLAYNDLVRANGAGADAVLDLTVHPVMGPVDAADNLSLYPDNLHPSSLGYAHLAGGGAYSDPATYYAALTAILQATALGAAYVP